MRRRYTFGFMSDAQEGDNNITLFCRLRELAIRSFKAERVAVLDSFAGDSIEACDRILRKNVGPEIRDLRDAYYAALDRRRVRVQFADIQSFFLYSFTRGLLPHSAALLDPDDISTPQIDVDQVFDRRFPIVGPQWLCSAANREMPAVQNVFCDFQDAVLRPLMVEDTPDYRLVADAIAGSFLWAYLAGSYWLRQGLHDIVDSFSGTPPPTAGQPCMVPFRKTMALLSGDEFERITLLSLAFDAMELPS